MKTSNTKSPRTRAKIIAELASLPNAIQGKICEDKRKLADGSTAVYHNEPEADERNAGNHGKKIVTLFGETPEFKRTYYWNEDTHKGHYPFDDRLGLIGCYTPAAANEMVRHAVNHGRKRAQKGYVLHTSDSYRSNFLHFT